MGLKCSKNGEGKKWEDRRESVEKGLTEFWWAVLKDRDHVGERGLWSKKGEIRCTYVDLQEQLENEEFFKYLGRMLTNDVGDV
jgi:hypothetical protein